MYVKRKESIRTKVPPTESASGFDSRWILSRLTSSFSSLRRFVPTILQGLNPVSVAVREDNGYFNILFNVLYITP